MVTMLDMMKLHRFIAVLLAVAAIVPTASGVTKEEMEKARAITAQAYLRYANNGSGYLDEFRASSMSELKSKLKKQELENLKSFEAVAVPADYAAWDKTKLVDYWSKTFFSSPGLLAEGKKARSRVASRLSAMTIAEPQPEAKEEPAEQPAIAAETEAGRPVEAVATEATAQDAAADSIPGEMANQPEPRRTNSYTWLYVVILCVLVGVVIWLVVYALNAMKRQPKGAEQQGGEQLPEPMEELSKHQTAERHRAEMGAIQANYSESLSRKDYEIAELRRDLESLRRRDGNSEIRIRDLEAEIATLRADLSEANRQLAEARKASASRPAMSIDTPAPTVSAPTEQPGVYAPEQPAETTRLQRRYTPQPERRRPVREIFLGRANSRGIFVRADRDYVAGQSLFILSTSDGISGSFTLIENDSVWETVLSAPEETLTGACTGHRLADTDGVVSVVNDQAGTAIFEGGCWRVVRKARISYD